MRKPWQPRIFQPMGVQFILDNPRCALFASMGSGKCVMTLTALDILRNVMGEETLPAIVFAPLRVARETWSDEASKWLHLQDTEVVTIVGNARERSAALGRKGTVFTCNYENIPWLAAELAGEFPFGHVVPDESVFVKSLRIHTTKKNNIAGQGGSRARELAKMAFAKSTRWTNLTGAPSPNGLKDLWGQQWFLDAGERLGRSFTAFSNRWFRSVPGSDGYNQIEPMPFAQAQIEAAIKDICLTIDIRDYYPINEPVDIDVVIDLPTKAMKIYKDMEKKMFAVLASGAEKEAFSSGAKTMACLQLASGACYLGEDDGKDTRAWEEVHDVKLQALSSIISEAAGAAMLIVYFFKSDLARLKKAFPKGRHFDKKDSTKKDFLDGRFTELFIHAQSGGHGVDGLQAVCHIIVFFSQDWNLDYYQQVTERVGPARQFQIGSKFNVMRYHIIARNTIDETVMERRKTKASVQECLLNAMKRRAA